MFVVVFRCGKAPGKVTADTGHATAGETQELWWSFAKMFKRLSKHAMKWSDRQSKCFQM